MMINPNTIFPGSIYQAAGGEETFTRLIENFYKGIESDALIRPMYPADLTESKRTMTLFVMQYFGGPRTYSDERGHPRLRMRHMPFSIGIAERDAWMKHMKNAVVAESFAPPIETALLDYFENTATFMINRLD